MLILPVEKKSILIKVLYEVSNYPDHFYLRVNGSLRPTEQEQAQQEQRQMELEQQETSGIHYNFRLEMDSVLTRYFGLKDALVESDPQQSAGKAQELSEFSAGVMDEVLDAEDRGLWLGIARIIQTETGNLADEDDVDEQRIYFERISNAMIQMVESFNPVGYTVYQKAARWCATARQTGSAAKRKSGIPTMANA